MAIDGFIPVPFTRLGSLVTRYPSETLPIGVSSEASNIRFGGKSIEAREGLDPTYGLAPVPTKPRITGLSHWQNIPLIWTSDGHLYIETAAGAQALQEILPESGQALAGLLNKFMQTAQAFKRTWIAFTDTSLQQGGGDPKFYDGTYLDQVGMPLQAGGVFPTQSPTVGNVDAGTRYCTFFFQTRSGYLQGFTQSNIAAVALDGMHQVQVTFPNIAIPKNAVAVIAAFTLSGATQNDDFFYIGEADTVGGISISSTVVPINGAMPPPTSFNFNDAILVGETNVTRNQDKIVLPQMSSVAYLKSLKRLCWCGDPAQKDVFYFTEANDPETVFGNTGLVIPDQNGEEAVGSCELDNGEIILLRQRSGWMVLPTTGDPATWEVRNRWSGHGPCGPRAFDVYENTLAYAHRSGAYLSDSGATPQPLSYEIEENNSGFDSPSWDKINWAQEHLIWCQIDGISKEIRFGVPYGNSALPNVIFKCFYGDGTNPSLQEAIDGSGLIATEGRKWSVDYITAHSMLRLYRPLPISPNPNTPVDQRILTTQVLVASAQQDGLVSILNPSCKTDFGGLIRVRYRTAFATRFAVNKLGGVEFQARGNGQLNVTAFSSRSDVGITLSTVDLEDAADAFVDYSDENGFRWGLLLTNSMNDGDWFQVQNLVMYLSQFWTVPQ